MHDLEFSRVIRECSSADLSIARDKRCQEENDNWDTEYRRGVIPEKLVRGVRPASQNPYPTFDQNVPFLVPDLWPDSYIIRGRGFVAGFI